MNYGIEIEGIIEIDGIEIEGGIVEGGIVDD